MRPELCIADLPQFRVPAVRHLAWLCGAPQLISGPSTFDFSGLLPRELPAALRRWDKEPRDGPSLLTQTPHPRLGLYFERLYECLMTEILGWELLAKNLPIQGEQRTLGELDFVLRNPSTGVIEHHEIAVKFYLGYASPEGPLWYGPNPRDRLDLKTRRLLEHQSRLTRRPETAAALKARGIDSPGVARVFMPGYLFHPSEPDLPPPPQAADNHQRGRWVTLDEARKMHTDHWVPLHKPHWLGPWLQAHPPDSRDTRAALDGVASTDTPRLFAHLQRESQSHQWIERDRLFVVPGHWPAITAQPRHQTPKKR